MPGSLAGLLQEAASVYRLVEFIEHFCVEQQSSRSYVAATTEFLELVVRLAEHTRQHLQEVANEATQRLVPGVPTSRLLNVWVDNERDSLHTIKDTWTIIHKYLKPAADAHALQVRIPLVNLAERQLASVKSMSRALIAVLVTPELNYFQTSHTRLKQAIQTLTKATRQTTDLGLGSIGFVELPFSQGPNLFNNVALYHELGHFALAESLEVGSDLKTAVGASLDTVASLQSAPRDRTKRAGIVNLSDNGPRKYFVTFLRFVLSALLSHLHHWKCSASSDC